MVPAALDKTCPFLLFPLVVLLMLLTGAISGSSAQSSPPELAIAATIASVPLSATEKRYLEHLGPITVCPDPDWVPYEQMDGNGNFSGIAADLMELISKRLGVTFTYIQTKDWDEAVALSQSGKVLLLPFLNQTPKRDAWLIFTEPLFLDPNVYITREEHPFITDASLLIDKIIAVPNGTSIEERVRHDFPNLKILNTANSEKETFKAVTDRRADITIRSLTVAAYTIRKEGLFNLKIAGQAPDEYTNRLRIGVLKGEPMLRDILNKGIATITSREREEIANRHVHITVVKPMDYGLMMRLAAVLAVLIGVSLYWNLRLKKINVALKMSECSKSELLANLKESRQNLIDIIEFLPDATLVVDKEMKVIAWNRAIEQMTGIGKEEMLGLGDHSHTVPFYGERRKMLLDLLDTDDAELSLTYQNVQRKNGVLYAECFASALYGGKGAHLWVAGTPLCDSEGNRSGAIEVIRDISERKLAAEELAESSRVLETLSLTDALTQLANRRHFDEVLTTEYSRHVRSGGELSLIMLDIDHFKTFNDSYGHLKGDECLKQVAHVLSDCVSRTIDLAARYGGEEFACILPDTDMHGAVVIAEKIRRGIQALAIPHKASSAAEHVTASLGVVTSVCSHERTALDLLAQADDLLYRAKSSGRNRIEIVSNQNFPVSMEELSGNFVQLVWKDFFCSGNRLIDQQHQALFTLSNELFDAILSGKSKELISAMIGRLLVDVTRHFHDEEIILEKVMFPGLPEHITEHAKLLAKGVELSSHFEAGTLSVGEVFQFLAYDVVMIHMLGADREYFQFMNNTEI